MKDTELLESIYQGSQMGRDSIMQLIKKTKDTNFRKALEEQLVEYQNIFDTSETMLRERGVTPTDIGSIAKMSQYMTSNLHTMHDDSPSHMADMMIKGSTMGISKISKNIHDYEGDDNSILDLSNRLLSTEKNNVEQMTSFL